MPKNLITILLLLSIPSTLLSQKDEILSVGRSDIPGAGFKPARTFTGESLYGYINGGADLYHEYGFLSVWVAEIDYMKGKYKTEIYRMKSAEAAFGIFSISRFKCKSTAPVSVYTCQTPYQLQVCSGPFYISIVNRTATETDSVASVRIAESIVKKITEESADLSGYLPGISRDIIREKALLVKGKLGLMNGASEWEDYFAGMSGYTLVLLPENDKTTLSVEFSAPGDLARFAALHGWKMDAITPLMNKVSDNESVRMLSDAHILIEVVQK
jgi:hypothetical protein